MPSIKPINRVNFIEYNAKVNTLAINRVFPKYGTVLLATILREKGYDVKVYLDGVSRMDFDMMTDCDVVCMPVFIPAFNKVKGCALRILEEKPHIPVIIGGPNAIMYPETMIDFCTYVVRCEGDEALPELLECIQSGGDVRKVKGILYKKNGRTISTPDRTPPSIPTIIPDMTLIQGFKRTVRWIGRLYNVVNTLQTSRGCKFTCKFCPTPKLFGGVYRNRDIDSIIKEIKDKQRYNSWFFVVDNSFAGNRAKTRDLLRRLINEDLGAELMVFERQEIGYDTEMLGLMKKAGVRCLIVGVESLIDENLKAFNKKQTAHKTIRALKNIKDSGIHVVGTFAFGYEGDTREKVDELVHFIKENKLSLNMFILHDVDESNTKDLMIPHRRRFKTYYQKADPNNTDYYDYITGSFATYFPAKMKPSTLQRCILDAYKRVYTHGYILSSIFRKDIFESLFGVTHGYSIRRMNRNIEKVVDNYYMDYLKRIEEGLYDEHEVLIEEKLASLKGLPIPEPLEEQVDLRSNTILILLALRIPFMRYLFHRLFWRIGRLFYGTFLKRRRVDVAIG